MEDNYPENTDQTNNVDIDNSQDENEDGNDFVQLSKEEHDTLVLEATRNKKEAEKFKKLFDNSRKHSKTLTTNEPNRATALTREEAILFARGMTEDDVEMASKVAGVEGTSLLEAVESPLYKGYKTANEEKLKSQKAQIPASRRGQTYEPPKDFKNTGGNRADHKAAFNVAMGRG